MWIVLLLLQCGKQRQEKYVSQLYFILLFYVLFLQLRRGNSMMAAANSVNSSRFATASTSRPNCPYVHCATTNC